MENIDVNELLSTPVIEACKKVLCIQPHPDDNEIGMGGVIHKLQEKGCKIHYLTVTDGRLGNTGLTYTPDELAEIRAKEAVAAGQSLGAEKFFHFGYKDGSLRDIPTLAGEIAEIIRDEQYDTVFSPDPWLTYEAHQDHVVTGKAVAQAAISCSLTAYPEETNSERFELTGVGLYFTASPNTVVDITEHFDRKFEAIALHKTQMNEQLLEIYRSYFKLRGNRLTGSDAVGEGLKMLKPLHLHCFPETEGV